jgi:hypothetical protein
MTEPKPDSDMAERAPGDQKVGQGAKKKIYQKPSFQHERVFETMALSCGKLSPTEMQCHFNRKHS